MDMKVFAIVTGLLTGFLTLAVLWCIHKWRKQNDQPVIWKLIKKVDHSIQMQNLSEESKSPLLSLELIIVSKDLIPIDNQGPNPCSDFNIEIDSKEECILIVTQEEFRRSI